MSIPSSFSSSPTRGKARFRHPKAAARDRYRTNPPLPNANPKHVTAHFIPKPLQGTPDLFSLRAKEKYQPDPVQFAKLVAKLQEDGFRVKEFHAGDSYVTASGPRKLFKTALRLTLARSSVRQVNGFRYRKNESPFTGPARPRRDDWRAFESRGLSAVVFPLVVELAADAVAPPAGAPLTLTLPLTLPDGLLAALRLEDVHANPARRGRGAKVVQLDSGRHTHPYFNRFDPATLGFADADPTHGHGTAMAAIFKTVAPDAHLITRSVFQSAGVDFTATFFELFGRVLRDDKPDIIFAPVILRTLIDRPRESLNQQQLGALVLFESLVADAERGGVLVLFAAGNDVGPDHRYVSASNPGVVSVGGCCLDPYPRRSNTNRFRSELYPTDVPDGAGPCGAGRTDAHLVLPIPHRDIASFGGASLVETPAGSFVHTWGGSSAATAAAAGMAAILKGTFPGDGVDELRRKLLKLIPDPPATPTIPPIPWPNWGVLGG